MLSELYITSYIEYLFSENPVRFVQKQFRRKEL